MAKVLEIQAYGFDAAAGKLKRVSVRFANARPAFELIQEMLEQGEQGIFRRLSKKDPDYVLTGHLMRSLTQPSADDAVRDAHATGLDFGTQTWYARFHRDEKGKLPYLRIMPKARKEIGPIVLGYVVGGMDVTV